MNKLFTKIATAFVGIAMAIGVGVAVGNNGDVRRAEAGTGSLTVTASDMGYTNTTYSNKTAVAVGSEGFKFSTTAVCKKSGTTVKDFQLKKSSGYLWNSDCPTGYTVSSIQLTNKSGGTVTVKKGSSAKPSTTVSAGSNNTYTINDKYFSISQPSAAAYFTLVINYSTGASKLPSPTNISYDNVNQRVKWDAVSNASSYKFSSDNGTSYTSTSTNLYASVSNLTTGTTYNCKVVAVGDGSNYSDSDAASFQFTKTEPASYTSVTVSGGSVQGTDIGSAYIQCTATATGTNIPASPSFTWYVTDTNTYDTTISVAGKASIDNTGKVTFVDSCTVYVWALAPDGTTHNTTGYAAASGNLKGSQTNPYSVSEAKAIADTLSSGQNNGLVVYCLGIVSAIGGSTSSKATSPVTFTIKDVDDSTKTLMAFSIQNGSTTDPEATNYVAVDYEVLIFGYLINYSGAKEIGFVSGDQNSSGFVYSHAPSLPEITALALDTSNVTTQFDLNSEFNYTGLVVTGTVDGVSGTAIPSGDYSVSTPDMTSQGQKEVTVTYTGTEYEHEGTISTSYNINVVIPSPDDTIDLIDDIGTVVYTQESYEKIVAARNSYDALPAQSQEKVTNYSTLTAAETTFGNLKTSAVANVVSLINNIGTVTLSSETAIVNAETAYDALLDGNLGKSLVSNHETLTAARAAYDQLVDDREAADSVEALITALPAPSSISDYSYHSQIAAARAAFNALNASAQGMVSNLQKLIDCETEDAKYAPSVQGTYAKVTDLSQLSAGATVIITNGDGTFAMGEQKSNNRGTATGAASAGGSITISSDSTDIQVFTIESYSTQTDTIVAFKTVNSLADVSGYLYAASSRSNYLKTQSSVDANAKFYVTLSSGSFTVSADDSSNRHIMKYNSSSSLFSCYSSGQQAVAIYVKGGVSTYTVTYDGNGSDGGTKPVDSTSYNSGDTVTVLDNTFTKTGYTFVSWNTAQDGSGSSYEKDEQFTITANVTLYAIWEEGGGGGSATAVRCYHLVTSTKDLVVGAKYIITNDVETGTGFFALGSQKTSNRDAEPVTSEKTGVAQVSSSAVEAITLGGSTGAWTLGVTDGYLYAAGSDKNYLKTRTENSDANSEWAISFSEGAASIVAQGSNRSVMQYNYNGGEEKALFSCYATASQSDVYLYRLDFGETLLANIDCGTGTGSHTMPEGYTWNTDLQGVYNDLPEGEKTSLASASSAGLERYDYIVGKYNPTGETDSSKTNYVHFIAGRTVTPRSSSGIVLLTVLGKNTTNTSIIVIVTVGIAAIAIGGYFLLRKKKED